MNRIFKLNQKPILNFADLQKKFSPLEAYRQLQAFRLFAQVHCKPLPLLLSHTQDGEPTKSMALYLDKDFWWDILQNAEQPDAQSASECFAYFRKKRYRKEIGIENFSGAEENALQGDTTKEEMDTEAADAQIEEKLAFICKSAGLGDNRDDACKAVVLLAICEMAEVNAMSCSFESPQTASHTAAVPVAKQDEITDFPYETNAALFVATKPYRYWYHDDDTLKAGSKITTVRVEAKGGSNKYDTVTLELYSLKNRECVQKIVLREGEYRYCNLADGKIIKFLSSVSISDSLCLLRKEYSQPEISVLANGADAWAFNMKSVSCFAAGEKDDGFLFVQNGKVGTGFYKAAESYMVRLKIEMVMEPVVEVEITPNGYELLTERGMVISDSASDGSMGVVSLNRSGRAPLPVVKNVPDVEETALSHTGGSVAVKVYGKNKDRIIFRGGENRFTLQQKQGAPVIAI